MHAIVRGRVQGVGFRASTVFEARSLGLRGWVKNLPDGNVEVLAMGDDAAVEALIAWLRQGPRGARVTGVSLDEPAASPAHDQLAGFTIR